MSGDDAATGPAQARMVRDAATVILVRDAGTRPRVLVGTRGAGAAFMPSMVVFPGGAVDPGDAQVPLASGLPAACAARLGDRSTCPPAAIAAAAIRELWEETGLFLGRPGAWPDPPPGWAGFAAAGLRPCAEALRFVFRAVTPPGQPRRFDARFLVADAAALAGDPDDLSAAGDELRDLGWHPLDRVRGMDLHRVTRMALDQVASRLPDLSPPDRVPFFTGADRLPLVETPGGPDA